MHGAQERGERKEIMHHSPFSHGGHIVPRDLKIFALLCLASLSSVSLRARLTMTNNAFFSLRRQYSRHVKKARTWSEFLQNAANLVHYNLLCRILIIFGLMVPKLVIIVIFNNKFSHSISSRLNDWKSTVLWIQQRCAD